jgi:hypothetical protein
MDLMFDAMTEAPARKQVPNLWPKIRPNLQHSWQPEFAYGLAPPGVCSSFGFVTYAEIDRFSASRCMLVGHGHWLVGHCDHFLQLVIYTVFVQTITIAL